MKGWHLAVLAILAYVVGALYPAPLTMVRAKLGI